MAADCFSLARLDDAAAQEPARQELMAECALLLGRLSPVYLPCISTISPPYLPCISPIPPHISLYLPLGRPHDAVALLKAALGEAAGQRAIGQTSNPNPEPDPDPNPDPNLTLTLTLTLALTLTVSLTLSLTLARPSGRRRASRSASPSSRSPTTAAASSSAVSPLSPYISLHLPFSPYT